MFWALEQRQKRMAVMRAEIAEQAERDLIARIVPFAKEKGITTIDELAKGLEEEHRRKEREEQAKSK